MLRFATLDVASGDAHSPMTVLTAVPGDGKGVYPALVLMPHRGGIDRYTIDRAERLAAAGIIVAAPDVYHWQDVTTLTPDAKEHLRDEQIEADIGAALGFLKLDTRVGKTRIGILGHCQGGRTALIGLVSYPDDFCLGVIYYGGSIFKRLGNPGPAPFERMGAIKCPVHGVFGNEDTNPSPDDVNRFDEELTRLGIAHEFHRFDGAGHAFQDFTDTRRGREPQGTQAWELTMEFLRRGLKPEA